MIQLKASYVQYHDSDGSPLDAGYVYFGESGANPETNPIQVYFDYEGTIPAAQPLRTNSGVIVRNGSPVRIYAPAVNYSCTVKDKKGNLVFSTLNFSPEAEDSAVDTVTTYAALRAYSGRKTRVNVTGLLSGSVPQGIAGTFVHMAGDTTSADNGGTIIVDDTGRRWHRDGWKSDFVNVKWFGATGDGSTNDTAAFTAARAVLETNSDFRGGVYFIPRGNYQLHSELAFTAYATGVVHNIFVKGEGHTSTYLNFTNAPSGTHGISFNKGLQFGVEGITISNAKLDGLSLVGGAVGSSDFLAMGTVERVRLQYCGRDGFRTQNSFMLGMREVWSHSNTGNGFSFMGFHTSVNASQCWGSGNGGSGWSLNGLVYSKFDACGTDDCALRGWTLSNVRGVSFNACGAERPGRECFFLATSDASAAGIPLEGQDIAGVSFNNCYAMHGNNTGAAGAYSTFMGIVTADSRPIDVTISGCNSWRKNVADPAITANAASGYVRIFESAPAYDGTVQTAGPDVYWEGRKFSWTPVLKGSSTVGTGTYTRQIGEYVLRDGLCHYSMEIAWSAHSGAGFMYIDDLPINSANSRNPSCLVDGDSVASTGVLGGYVEAAGKIIRLTQTPLGGTRSFINVDTSGSLWINGIYEYK
jgi:hypothetical protein